MTPIRMEVLRFIAEHFAQRGYAPTLQEIAAQRNVSKVTVFECLKLLVQHGYLSRPYKRQYRNLALTEKGRAVLAAGGACPNCGRDGSAAGEPETGLTG